MIAVDLRENRWTSNILPPQAIPTKDKTEDWGKDCMDALENIGLRQLAINREKFDRAYRLTEGDFQYSDIAESSLFLSEIDQWRSQADLKDNIEHYGFIEPLVNQLIGEFLKKPDPIIVDAVDPLSTSEYTRMKTDMLWQHVSSTFEEELNNRLAMSGLDPFRQEFESEEQQQQYQQMVQQEKQKKTPRDIEKFMNQDWKSIYVEWAETTLKEDRLRFDLDELDRDAIYDFLVTGRCFRHHRVGYDYYHPERWCPKETFCAATSKTRYVENGDYVGRIKYYTPNEVIAHFGHKLSEEQKIKITSSEYYYDKTGRSGRTAGGSLKRLVETGGGELRHVPFPSYYPYMNAKHIQDVTGINLGINDMFPNGQQYGIPYDSEDEFRLDLIRVVEGYWVSQQRVGYLTAIDEETGEIITETVTDEILPRYLKENEIKQLKTVSLEQHEANPTAGTIVWDYIPIVYYGAKICKMENQLDEDLYLDMKPYQAQLKGNSETYHTKLPVTGIVEKTSFVGKLYQYQIDHNIAMNMARDYMSKELGLFYLMDFSYLPAWIKDAGGEEALSKLYDVIRELGFLPIDGEAQNTRSAFNQFTAVNMDLTQAMIGKLEYATLVKRLAFENIGMTPERMGTTVEQSTATGVNQSLNASFAQTEVIYDKFAKHQRSDAEVHLNIAQIAKSEGIDRTVNYVDSDKIRTFFTINDPYLPIRRFRIIPQNNSKRRSELEVIKQVYMNDNTIQKDLESIAEVVSSDSVSKIIQLGRIGREIAQLEQEKQRLHEQQMLQAKLESDGLEKEREREFKAKERELDRQLELRKSFMVAMGFADDAERRQALIDELKMNVETLKVQTDIENKELSRQDERLKQERDYLIQQRKLDIESQKNDVEKYKADKTLEVARENKFKHEMKGSKKTNNK